METYQTALIIIGTIILAFFILKRNKQNPKNWKMVKVKEKFCVKDSEKENCDDVERYKARFISTGFETPAFTSESEVKNYIDNLRK